MLILTRKVGETIIINDNIKVTVVGVNGYQVRLGIEAPKDVIVNRKEIQEKIDEEKRQGFVYPPKAKVISEPVKKVEPKILYKKRPNDVPADSLLVS